jgi:hypothetical protein
MKMANGGYDPAYNVQFASDGDARVIVGVEVTNPAWTGRVERARRTAGYGKTPKRELRWSFATGRRYRCGAAAEVVSSIPRSNWRGTAGSARS